MRFKIATALVVALLAFVGVVVMQPDTFRVSRTTEIQAPPAVAYAQVDDFHDWAWNPWAKIDPEMKVTYGGSPSGVGQTYAWAGNAEIGEGKMTIEELRPNELVRVRLDFVKPLASTSMAEFTFAPAGAGTLVTWSMSGEASFLAKAIHLFLDMDAMIGGQFEKGLADMKAQAEAARGAQVG